MIIHFGVLDVPYGYGDDPDATTYSVAVELEQNYKIMKLFNKVYGNDIRQEVVKKISHMLADQLQYNNPPPSEFALGDTIDKFRLWLSTKEVEQYAPNTPTLAAIIGINSRTKQDTPGRPSFIDGGLYESSFQAWLEL